ncbi:MAG: prepilin-type N-terminal cleavage/methylation domain-containing protein [Deltaproteobacteria bacterium]|nr:prepilin-type N-terminal cleavage/methylation domain-containing protein [Deltaproteobacteria bacterium]MBW1915209.1 prepilin-type N-terminal cleavage/methylation domain-containing protein [Deltaproteobacteria bacterium]
MKSKVENRPGEAGFTMVEVIISIAILSIGLLGVASMQGYALYGDSFSYNLAQGANYGQDKIEEFVAISYDDVILGSDEENTPDGLYKITWVVTAGTLADTKEVNLTVWKIGDPNDRKITEMVCLRTRLI